VAAEVCEKGDEMTYLEYQARQFVDTWYHRLTQAEADLVSYAMRAKLQEVIAQTWKEERVVEDGKL
jgi:mannosyltransferase OCH1-like enzyme